MKKIIFFNTSNGWNLLSYFSKNHPEISGNHLDKKLIKIKILYLKKNKKKKKSEKYRCKRRIYK